MKKRVIHGTTVYESINEAAEGIGVHKNTVLRALKAGFPILGARISYYHEPKKIGERPGLVSAESSSGPLIKHPITHGIGIL